MQLSAVLHDTDCDNLTFFELDKALGDMINKHMEKECVCRRSGNVSDYCEAQYKRRMLLDIQTGLREGMGTTKQRTVHNAWLVEVARDKGAEIRRKLHDEKLRSLNIRCDFQVVS